jgi:mannose-6-phosphate isomerase-like protein (cupin superfamily)
MPLEMDADEIRQMSLEERTRYEAEIEQRLIRFKETRPVESPFDEARLPGNERALYPYIGLGSAVHTEFRSKLPEGENFCLTLIMAQPGRGAPLHAHTTEEIFIALTGRWGIFWGDEGEHEVILEPWDAVSVPAPSMRGFRNAGTEDAFMLCILGGSTPPPPIYHPKVIEQVEEWHSHTAGQPLSKPIAAR